MDEARAVLARLDRIEALNSSEAPPDVLLGELRQLLLEAEAWIGAETGPTAGAEDAIARLRTAVAQAGSV